MVSAGNLAPVTTLPADAAEAAGEGCSSGVVAAEKRVEREQRLRELVAEHYDFVWRSLRRLGVSNTDAEDAAQEVFVSLSRRLADVERGRERGFLYRTAVHHAAHVHRSRLRRRESPQAMLDDRPDCAPSPEELLDCARAKELVYRILDRLELDLRAVFVLYELEQLTMAQISEVLEIPSGTVASRLRRARAAFLEHVRRATGRNEDGGT